MIIEPVVNASSAPRMHWTRIVLIAGALLVVVSTFLPWLVGVPPDILKFGSGTIRGISTVHGIIACVAMVGVIVLALLQPRGLRPRRSILGAILAIDVVTLGVSSLVLGTSKKEIFEEIDKIAPNADAANLAVIGMAEKLRDFDSGYGGIVLTLGCAVLGLTALVAMFVKRSR